MKVLYLILLLVLSSCAVNIHTTPYSLIDEKPVYFGMDKDSINFLTEIHYVDITDTNRASYYLKDQMMFDSLILRFYQGKLYELDGFIRNDHKVEALYNRLCTSFKSYKSNKSFYYFQKQNKNYYLNLGYDQSDSLYAFSFFESNIYDAFIFHCGYRRIRIFSMNPFSDRYIRKRNRKRNKIRDALNLRADI